MRTSDGIRKWTEDLASLSLPADGVFSSEKSNPIKIFSVKRDSVSKSVAKQLGKLLFQAFNGNREVSFLMLNIRIPRCIDSNVYSWSVLLSWRKSFQRNDWSTKLYLQGNIKPNQGRANPGLKVDRSINFSYIKMFLAS